MDGISLGGATHHKLAHHDGHCNEDHHDEIDEYEGCASISTCFRGEAPDVAKTYGATCRGKNYA